MRFFATQLKSYPFVRLLAGLIVGILWSYFGLLPRVAGWLFLSLIIIIWLISRMLMKRFVIFKIHQGLLMLMVMIATGYIIMEVEKDKKNAAFRELNPGMYLAKIMDIPVEKKQKLRCQLELHQLDSSGLNLMEKSGLIQAYIQPDSITPGLRPGSWMLLNLQPMRIKSDGNPDAFDYAGYMEQRGIWFQCQLTSGNWKLLDGTFTGLPPPGFMDRISYVRYLIIRNLHTSGLDPPVQAFVGALILGFKDELDAELKANFTSIGVVHVLAVSGLHVAIIYVVLEKLFFLLIYLPFGKWIRFLLILLFLWFYVFLAGFSPSVLRAAFMFTLVLIARNINRDSSMYNIMAASAFIILVLNPEALFDLGFLFSYLAVLGIVMLQPWMLESLTFRYSWINKLWASISLSLTAQLLVTPISIHYFHTFPVWFIPANLTIVPLVVAYTYPAALVMIIPQHGWIYEMLCKLLNAGYVLTVYLADLFDSLPYSSISRLRLDIVQVMLLYVLIVVLLFFLMKKNPSLVSWLLLVFLIFWGYSLFRDEQFSNQHKMVVFNVSGGWMMAVLSGDNADLLLFNADSSMVEKKAMNYLVNQGIEDLSVYQLNDSVDFRGKSFEKVGNYLLWQDQVFYLKFLKKKGRINGIFHDADWILSDYPVRDTLGIFNQICRYNSSFNQVKPERQFHCLTDQGAKLFPGI